ncbi:hypothetical protein BDK92_4921 [Micromonospora pisi]|uniref:Uncharacterized protein n=1 Tax=Micromonospora pisi TaxID=589240 RepID=A0A495JPI8_9ACTN|nr:hypothetical protein BDK92_4921 [Micromonospora pisi]
MPKQYPRDARNHAARLVIKRRLTVSYGCDGLGRRSNRENAGTNSKFLYDGTDTLGGRWIDAVELRHGQWLKTSAGHLVQVAGTNAHTQHATVYNLSLIGKVRIAGWAALRAGAGCCRPGVCASYGRKGLAVPFQETCSASRARVQATKSTQRSRSRSLSC